MRVKLFVILLVSGMILVPLQTALAAPQAEVSDNRVRISFPESATFSATLSADADITTIVLEYGNEQLTCGSVIAKAFPEFQPSNPVEVEWTWDMRQSGSLPPGATLWWRWRYKDQTGAEYVSDTQTATWLDDRHDWQSLSSGDLQLHWYEGDQSFAQELLDAAAGGLTFNETRSGLIPDAPIDLYIYSNTNDMQEAILYEPSWTGGMAFPEQDIVILGISASDMVWGRNAIVHELTHVLVGHLTFTCLGDVPTWLNEGLAVYSEGQLDQASQGQLDQAIRDDTLLSVRSLSGGFSEVADKATLSYSQSYSLVRFLIETYGQEKMTALLVALRDGRTIDDALTGVYGFDVDGLEDEWRGTIGAAPRPVSAQPTAQPTPTYVPTIIPISGAPLAVTPTPYVIPTSSFVNPSPTAGSGPPRALTIALIGFCCLLGLIMGVIVLGVVVRAQNRKGGSHG
jgi:hypothetical protein